MPQMQWDIARYCPEPGHCCAVHDADDWRAYPHNM